MQENSKVSQIGKVTTFYVNGALCGIEILTIQEVNKVTDITPVPLAPDHVKGIINLRGKIVTLIDLGSRLGLSSNDADLLVGGRNIIVHSQGELIGLLVDRVGEALEVDWADMVPPPSNIQGVQGRYFKGVIKRDEGLIGVLDVEEVLK